MEAGLPNAIGWFKHTTAWAVAGTGVFYPSTAGVNGNSGGNYNDVNGGCNLNLSRASSVYGKSDKVTPESLKAIMFIKY